MSFRTMRGTAFFKRSVAVLGAGTLSASAVVALSAPASADSHVQNLQAACEGLTDSVGFEDIQGMHARTQDAINCLAQYGITQGRSDTSYAPRDAVKRYEMAIFLDRVIGYVDEFDTLGLEFVRDTTPVGFQDLDGVPTEGVNAINAIANLGIAQGKSATAYDPYAPVTRRDMASFINRIQEAIAAQVAGYEGYDPTAATKEFDDVPASLARSGDIYALEAAGIVQGTSANTYKPFAAVLRSEMAFFIMRHLNENIAKGRVASLTDTTGPTVTASAVAAGSTTVVFTADEHVDAASVDSATDFTETAAADITSVDTAGNTITVTFGSALAAGESVTLLANSITDVIGNPGPGGDLTVTAAAAADTTGPVVGSSTVQAGVDTVTFTADEDLAVASVADTDVSTTSTVASITGVSASGATITVTLSGGLAHGDTVTLAANSVTDVASNPGPVQAATVTAEDTTAPGVTLVQPESAGHVNTDMRFVSGSTEAGAGVTVLNEAGTVVEIRETVDGPVLTSTTADGTGAFDFYAVLAQNTTNDFTLVASDEAGNDSTVAVPTIVHDNIDPEATVEAGTAGSTTVTITFTERINTTSLTPGDIAVNGVALTDTDATIAFGVTAVDETVATVTLTAALATNDVVTLTAGSVTDYATNTGPTTAASDTVV